MALAENLAADDKRLKVKTYRKCRRVFDFDFELLAQNFL